MPRALPALLVAGAFLAVLVWKNGRAMRLRNALTFSGALADLLALAVQAAVARDRSAVGALVGGLLGGGALYALLFAGLLAPPAAMGFGVVKASLLVGLAAGAQGLVPWLVAVATLLLTLAGSWVRVWRSGTRRQIPMGPHLGAALAAAAVAAFR